MAPMLEDDDDEFIHTISDNDPDVEETEVEQAPPSKKRKRDSKDGNAANSASKKGSNQQKDKRRKQALNGSGEGDEFTLDNVAQYGSAEEDDDGIASDFEFAPGDLYSGALEDFDGWETGASRDGNKRVASKATGVDAIIERRRQEKQKAEENEENDEVEADFEGFGDDDELLADDAFGMGANPEDESGEEDKDEQDSEDEVEDDNGSQAEDSDDEVAAPMPHPDDLEPQSSSGEDEEDAAEAKRRAEFFASEGNIEGLEPSPKGLGSFQDMSLSRPILRGLSAVGFTEPTPIQAKTIPVALLGKDVVGSAVTGSGKTAAFMIPILERLLYRPKKVPTTRVAVIMPTRELAVQCFNVSTKLASFTDITVAQVVGGFSLREQENVLKTRPDVVIATPGRFIDHVRHSPSFAVDTLEILVLDEADRMLEEGFANELNEILSLIPKSRQTMLFSATMTESIDKLIRVGLNRPVRVMVDAKKRTVSGLVQEFIRLRPGKEDKRLAYLMYLCEKVYTDRVIIFFRQKKEAHRIRIIFGLCGMKAGELHGSMSQEQRINAIESFRSGSVNFLLATDLASRGLDIKNVSVVLNYSTPQTHEIYLHRVGRTARAGRTGHACTLAAEPDRKVVRAAVKAARAQGAKVVSRTIPNDEVDRWDKKLSDLEEDVEAVLAEEREERALSTAERDLTKSENLVKYEKEIKSRPKRTWFETEKEKKQAKLKGRIELNGEAAANGAKKDKKKKLSGKEKKRLEERDIRREGKVWKKGKDERAGKGVLAEAKKGKGGKGATSKGKPKKTTGRTR